VQLQSVLEQRADTIPTSPALVCGERRLTYADVERSSNVLGHLLRDAGMLRGNRVAIYLENSTEAVFGLFGTLKADGVFMMVNPTTKADKLRFLLNNARATVVITDSRRLPIVEQAAAGVASLKAVFVAGTPTDATDVCGRRIVWLDAALADDSRSHRPDSQGIDIDLAALLYTSGSTGRPKGVMMTHHNMVSALTSISQYLGSRDGDVILNVLPLSFDYGLYQVLLAFEAGGTLVLERSFTYPHAALSTLTRERVTAFPIVPTIAALLLQLDLSQYDFSSLRYITNTGAALPVPHIAALRRLMPQVRIFSMYGITECKRVSYLDPDEIDQRPDSVGRGMPNQEIYLVDANGARIASGVGELVVRGSHVMQGYWELPEETARVLAPGDLPGERVLRTGDVFRMDADGYLYFVARTDDIIKTRGEKVSPREVENVLYRLPGVAEAAVLGVPDATLGALVKAVIVPSENATVNEQDVYRHCSQHLEDFMVPGLVEFRPAMARTPSGKVDKKAMVEPSATANARYASVDA